MPFPLTGRVEYRLDLRPNGAAAADAADANEKDADAPLRRIDPRDTPPRPPWIDGVGYFFVPDGCRRDPDDRDGGALPEADSSSPSPSPSIRGFRAAPFSPPPRWAHGIPLIVPLSLVRAAAYAASETSPPRATLTDYSVAKLPLSESGE